MFILKCYFFVLFGCFVVSIHDGLLKVSTFYTDYDRSQGLTVLYSMLEMSVSLTIIVCVTFM